MTILYGVVLGYTPQSVGFAIHLGFKLTVGVKYDIQISSDGGATWLSAGEIDVPAGTPEIAANWSSSIMVPSGMPVRLVQKA